MNISQLSIFLENKPGRLQHVLKILADKNINIKTLTIAEVNDFGILRIIVNKPQDAHSALKAEHITCSMTDVLAVCINDTPGSLYKLIDTFAKRSLNIEYMYAFTEKADDKAVDEKKKTPAAKAEAKPKAAAKPKAPAKAKAPAKPRAPRKPQAGGDA